MLSAAAEPMGREEAVPASTQQVWTQSPSHPSPARMQRAGAGGCYKGVQRGPSKQALASVWKRQGRLLPAPWTAGKGGAGAAPQRKGPLGGFPRAVSYKRAKRAAATGLAGGRARPRPAPPAPSPDSLATGVRASSLIGPSRRGTRG